MLPRVEHIAIFRRERCGLPGDGVDAIHTDDGHNPPTCAVGDVDRVIGPGAPGHPVFAPVVVQRQHAAAVALYQPNVRQR
ncbi:hypothetical protein SDC9_182886 [bioreactor metagenome]|uniref:Uncharacterized protein n=1 Tax=bioreactor metagenome TaxID=1076179 RepID=A0A645H8T8_9ZZZZ